MIQCRECRDGRMVPAEVPIEREVAEHTFRVMVSGLRCEACGAGEVDAAALQAFDLEVARALVSAPPTGAAVEWVRKALGYTGAELGALLRVRLETVSGWERGERTIGHAAWTLLGLLAVDRRGTEAALRTTGAAELPTEVTIGAADEPAADEPAADPGLTAEPLQARIGSAPGLAFRIKGALVGGEKHGAVRVGTIREWERIAVLASVKYKGARCWVLEPAPGGEPAEIAFEGFYVRGRFRVVEKYNRERRARDAFAAFAQRHERPAGMATPPRAGRDVSHRDRVSAVPSVYCYEEGSDGFGLYLGEISTADGLALFDPNSSITILEFGAAGYERLGWATARDLPPLRTAGAVRAFLDAHERLGLIDFEARLGDEVTIAWHDDGECHLRFRDREALIEVLQQVAPAAHAGRVLNAVLTSPGRYVVCDPKGAITTFATFEAYLASPRG